MDQDFIAYRLDELKDDQKAMIDNFNEFKNSIENKLLILHDDIQELKIKASIWGALAGVIATGIIYVISRIFGSKL